MVVGNDLWVSVTNGRCQYNSNPASGQDHWTYNEVRTESCGGDAGKVYVTTCENAGSKNCRANTSCIVAKYTEDGRRIYDVDYANDSVEIIYDFVEQQINIGNDSGSENFNDIKNDFLIYRNITWESNQETGEVIKTISITSVEVVNE